MNTLAGYVLSGRSVSLALCRPRSHSSIQEVDLNHLSTRQSIVRGQAFCVDCVMATADRNEVPAFRVVEDAAWSGVPSKLGIALDKAYHLVPVVSTDGFADDDYSFSSANFTASVSPHCSFPPPTSDTSEFGWVGLL